MPRVRACVTSLAILVLFVLSVAGTNAQSLSAVQTSPAYQVWYFASDDANPLPRVEYRNANGVAVASYTLGSDTFNWPHHGGGVLYGYGDRMIPVFNPAVGLITFQQLEGWQPDGDTYWYTMTQLAPYPTSTMFAYGVMQQPIDWEQSATSWIYVMMPGQATAQLVNTTTTESYMAVTPVGWANDGHTLLIQDMPQGIGGYILFWQHINVRALDITTGTLNTLGNLDGYAPDLQQIAYIEHDDAGNVSGLTLKALGSGAEAFHPLPNLGEAVVLGGDATFSPDGSQVAYQVARGNPENEKYWTILLNIVTGESRVVLEDEQVGYEVRYANIGGWLDDNTLVVGDTWTGNSAVVDAGTGGFLYEAPGSFLGLAPDTTSFAPSGLVYAMCPGAPMSRLMPQMRGRITITDGSTTNVRVEPGLDAEKTTVLPEGTPFTVSSGPTCADGYAWWSLSFDDGTYGYVAEGDAQEYYLEPWSGN